MKILMFAPQFAPLIESGAKTTTLRRKRKRRLKAGECVSLRTWEGKAFRSRMRTIREVQITAIEPVKVTRARKFDGHFFVTLGTMFLMAEQCDSMARHDGFPDGASMYEWLEKNGGLPFEGERISWE